MTEYLKGIIIVLLAQVNRLIAARIASGGKSEHHSAT